MGRRLQKIYRKFSIFTRKYTHGGMLCLMKKDEKRANCIRAAKVLICADCHLHGFTRGLFIKWHTFLASSSNMRKSMNCLQNFSDSDSFITRAAVVGTIEKHYWRNTTCMH